MTKKNTRFKHDVAFSFAGQDRKLVESYVEASEAIGLKVFYDNDNMPRIWGKNRKVFSSVYSTETAFVVPIISKHYPEKEWTQWEFNTARREARNRDCEFILPIKTDDTRQFGIADDDVYLPADAFSPEQIAKLLKAKVEAHYPKQRPTPKQSQKAPLLTRTARKTLGLIVAAPCPFTEGLFLKLFPNLEWKKLVRQFKAKNLIEKSGTLISSRKSIERYFAEEMDELKEIWTAKLEEVSDHIDGAFYLSLHYLNLKKYDDAVSLLTDVVLSTDLDSWFEAYQSAIEALPKSRIWRKLTPETRLAVHNALGLIFSNDNRPEEARIQLKKLFREAKRQGEHNIAGDALLNLGLNYESQGDFKTTKDYFEKARRHAIQHEDIVVESHALHNLGHLLFEKDPLKAISYLKQCIKYRKKVKNRVGVAESLHLLAAAYFEAEEGKKAFECLDESKLIAEELGDRELQATVLLNRAKSLLICERQSEALRDFRHSFRIAKTEKFHDIQIECAMEISRIHFEKENFVEAEKAMLQLLELAKSCGHTEYELTAHHGLWIVNSVFNNTKTRNSHYHSLLRLARKVNKENWIVRTLIDKSRPVEANVIGPPNLKKFRNLVLTESRRGNSRLAGTLWFHLAHFSEEQNIIDTEAAYQKAIEYFKKNSETVNHTLEAFQELYEIRWNHGKYDEAIVTLDSMRTFAIENDNHQAEIATLDQKGFCLQELGELKEALPLHEEAVKRSAKLKLQVQSINSLHNLAECYRRNNNPKKAIKYFEKAKRVAAELNDQESVIMTDHGRALALQSLGDTKTANALFKICQKSSATIGCWTEYIRASEAIANLSWDSGRKKTAAKQYESVLDDCHKYEILIAIPRIATNYSNLLIQLGENTKACRIIEKYLREVNDLNFFVDSHVTLAEQYDKSKEYEKSIEHWQMAIDSSTDEEEFSYYKLQLSDVEHKLIRQNTTVEELEQQLIKRQAPSKRASIQIWLFDMLLEENSESQADALFNESEKYMSKHGLTDQLIELYMLVFDHNWKGNRTSRLNALQAYVAAYMVAYETNAPDEKVGDITCHVMKKLTLSESAPTVQQLSWLLSKLEHWLQEQGVEDQEIISMLTIPVIFAQKLIPFNKDPERMLVEYERIIKELD